MIRTHTAGSLRPTHAGQPVTLAGWVARRRDHGGVAFIDLRDASGSVQVVIRDEAVAADLRNEYVLRVVGEVQTRPEGNDNPNLPTGEVEVVASEVEVLGESAPLPFQIDEHVDVGEEARLRYRYLDLRRAGPAAALRLRSKVNQAAREVLLGQDFVEIETPTLTRSTPEGARDFLVPARLQPGSWYALPQTPQLFKQLLMVAGMERYFQIARCYRDEDFRADRQPEFTQLDIEMSFVDQDDVIALGEQVLVALWRLIGHEIPTPIPRMTYAESMRRYGSDKPDLRFGLELVDATEFFNETPFRVFQAPHVGAVVMPGGAAQSRKQLDGWQDWAKQRGARGLAYVLVGEDGELGGTDREEPLGRGADRPGRACRRGAGRRGVLRCGHAGRGAVAARCRAAGDRPPVGPDRRVRLGVPVGRRRADVRAEAAARASGDVAVGGGAWTAVHHPFTSPKPEWLDRFEEDPEHALAYAYDIVCNGNEIGGGSIRIHRGDVQERVFSVMGLTEEEAREKFGFLLEAFSFGAPPHGGIALGWDRIVALLAGAESIRDVIAFPKSGGGYDPLTGAPAPIAAAQRKEAGVDAVPEPKGGSGLSGDPGGATRAPVRVESPGSPGRGGRW